MKPPSKHDAVLEWIRDAHPEALRLEPDEYYDKHIVGVAYRFGFGPVLAYDMPGILRSHVEEGMTDEEAEEYFMFNTLGAWVGEGTPVFIDQDIWKPGETNGP